MRFKELTNKSETELRKDLEQFRKEAEELRVKMRLGEVKNFKALRKIKRDIARIIFKLSTLK